MKTSVSGRISDPHEVPDAEMKPYAEHQEGHPNLGELRSLVGIRDYSGCEWTYGYPGQE